MQPSPVPDHTTSARPVVLITGGARRIGAAITRQLHQAGMDVLIHYFESGDAATKLAAQLNQQVRESAAVLQQDLRDPDSCRELIDAARQLRPRLDALVHNASLFRSSPLTEYNDSNWSGMLELHLQAPMSLARHAAPALNSTSGCMVFITDIYARKARSSHSAYCASKAGLDMLMRCLAQQLGPNIRVNAIAPGAILWPANENSAEDMGKIVRSIPLGSIGTPEHIAAAARFLIQGASYITGATITVDGGRNLNL